MRVIKSVGLIGLGVLLGIAASTASSRVEAQAAQRFHFTQPEFQFAQPIQEPGRAIQSGQTEGSIITGENIGFQLVQTPTNRGDVATGKLMIKVNGRWLPASYSTELRLAR